MASVKYGSIVTEIKGKLGGHVFQKCGQSLSLRTNLSKRLPSSRQARQARQAVSVLSSAWRGLTQAQKDSFTNNAPTFPTVDKFGNSVILTGYQLFFMLNKRLLLINEAIVTTCVAWNPPATSDIDFDDYTVSTGQFDLLWNNPIDAGTAVILYVSQLTPGYSQNLHPPLVFCTLIPDGTAIGTNYYNDVTNSFKSHPHVGNYFSWEAWKIDLATGQAIIDNGAQVPITL